MNERHGRLPTGCTSQVPPVVGPKQRGTGHNGQNDMTWGVAPLENVHIVAITIINCHFVETTAIGRPKFQSIIHHHIHSDIAIRAFIGVVANNSISIRSNQKVCLKIFVEIVH
jgi:hypothetical protein